MSKVLIGIITSDQSWFKMFDKYVLKNHSEDLKIINLNASKGEGPEYVDILLIDKSTGESGQDTTDLSAFTAQAGKSVYLIDQKMRPTRKTAYLSTCLRINWSHAF